MWLFITINISSVSSCNTFEKFVEDRNSVTCNLCHWKVYLKCNYLRYVEYQYLKYSSKWPIILWYRFLWKLPCDSLPSPNKTSHLFICLVNSIIPCLIQTAILKILWTVNIIVLIKWITYKLVMVKDLSLFST